MTTTENAFFADFDVKKQELKTLSRVHFEGVTIQHSHSSDTLAVFGGNAGELIILIFRTGRHYLVTARLPEGRHFKFLQILDRNNHILASDNLGNSFIISISPKYIKKTAFDVSPNLIPDFFTVTHLKLPLHARPVLATYTTPACFLDKQGRLYPLSLPSDPLDQPVHSFDFLNYLKSHNFEHKRSLLSLQHSPSLSAQLHHLPSPLAVPSVLSGLPGPLGVFAARGNVGVVNSLCLGVFSEKEWAGKARGRREVGREVVPQVKIALKLLQQRPKEINLPVLPEPSQSPSSKSVPINPNRTFQDMARLVTEIDNLNTVFHKKVSNGTNNTLLVTQEEMDNIIKEVARKHSASRQQRGILRTSNRYAMNPRAGAQPTIRQQRERTFRINSRSFAL